MVKHKPVIETGINSVALAVFAFGTSLLLQKDPFGFLLIIFGTTLEYFKYWGRNKNLW